MAIHTPAVHPRLVPTIPDLAPAALALVLFALLGAGLLLINPTTPINAQAGLDDQRHGEIDAGRTGPHSDFLIFRSGEIRAANE